MGSAPTVQPSWQADATPPKVTVGVAGRRAPWIGATAPSPTSPAETGSRLTRCTGTVPDGAAVDTPAPSARTPSPSPPRRRPQHHDGDGHLTPSSAGGPTRGSAGSDPDVGDDVYNTTAVGQKAEATVTASPGARATFTVTFQNDGTRGERFLLGQGTTATSGSCTSPAGRRHAPGGERHLRHGSDRARPLTTHHLRDHLQERRPGHRRSAAP